VKGKVASFELEKTVGGDGPRSGQKKIVKFAKNKRKGKGKKKDRNKKKLGKRFATSEPPKTRHSKRKEDVPMKKTSRGAKSKNETPPCGNQTRFKSRYKPHSYENKDKRWRPVRSGRKNFP